MVIFVGDDLIKASFVNKLRLYGHQVMTPIQNVHPDAYLYASSTRSKSKHNFDTELSMMNEFESFQKFEAKTEGTLLLNVKGHTDEELIEMLKHRAYSPLFEQPHS